MDAVELVLIALDGRLEFLLLVMDFLTFVLPIAFIARDVLQIFVGRDVVLAHQLGSLGDDILGDAYLAGNLDGERTARVANAKLEEGLHLLTVVEHRAVDDASGVLFMLSKCDE